MEHSCTWAAVLAGGAGKRFWPASRKGMPKPFIDVLGTGPLIRQTLERIEPVVPATRMLLVLGEHLVPLTRRMLPARYRKNLVVEPIARNTLGAVLLAMGYVLSRDPDGRLAILPSDHVIMDVDGFRATLAGAFKLALRFIVTLGIKPTRAESGYGYIQVATDMGAHGVSRFHRGAARPSVVSLGVKRFIEKPDPAAAARFVADGGYFWNCGIWVFHVQRFLEQLRALEPGYARVVDSVAALYAAGEPDPGRLVELLRPLPDRNVDKAVMERCRSMVMLPCTFGWSDVGTWDGLFEHRKQSADNFTCGKVVVEQGSGNVVVTTPGAPAVAVLGLSDVVVVATPDGILVTRRGQGQEVGKLVDKLEKLGHTDLL